MQLTISILDGKKATTVEMKLDAIGYTFPEGDSLLLMIAPGSFPTIWPTPQPAGITINGGKIKVPTAEITDIDANSLFAREDLVPRLGPAKNDLPKPYLSAFVINLHFTSQ